MNSPLSPEQVVFRLLAAAWDPQSLPPAESIPWSEVLGLLSLGSVSGAVYCAARGMGSGLPPDIEHELRRRYYLTIAQNTRIQHQLGQVGAALSAAGVPSLLLKGAAFVPALYPDPGSRLIGDIDLAVPPEHVETCRQLLIDQGYTAVYLKSQPANQPEVDNQEAFRPRSPHQTSVELHWHVVDVPYYLRRLPMDWFWANSEESLIAGQRFRVLKPEANLVYLPAHLALHHRFQGFHSYLDLALLIVKYQGQIDWAATVAAASSFGLVSVLSATIDRLARYWPSLPLDEPRKHLTGVLPSAMDARLFRLLTAESGNKTMDFYARVISLPDLPSRVHFVLQNLFPPPAYMMGRYPIRGRWHLPCWYLYRILDGFSRYLRTLRSARRLKG